MPRRPHAPSSVISMFGQTPLEEGSAYVGWPAPNCPGNGGDKMLSGGRASRKLNACAGLARWRHVSREESAHHSEMILPTVPSGRHARELSGAIESSFYAASFV